MTGKTKADPKAAQKAIADELYRAKHGPFIEGDVVRLKSGGPNMTVSNLPQNAPDDIREGDLLCLYFVGDQIRSFYFSSELLTGVPSPQED